MKNLSYSENALTSSKEEVKEQQPQKEKLTREQLLERLQQLTTATKDTISQHHELYKEFPECNLYSVISGLEHGLTRLKSIVQGVKEEE